MASKILILHQLIDENSNESEKDVLSQVELARRCLETNGCKVVILSCTLDLESLRNRLLSTKPDLVVNLVESLGGSDALAELVPALLKDTKIPFTGNSHLAMVLANSKTTAKSIMLDKKINTAKWWLLGCESVAADLELPFIVKAIDDHASLGLTDENVFIDQEDINSRFEKVLDKFSGKKVFAEQFISGREFNISILETTDGPVVLPAAEMKFVNYPEGKPQIIGWEAKWHEESEEYGSTQRNFIFDDSDTALLGELQNISLQCWKDFSLTGYARVDFRVDADSKPYVLEINTNPCLSEDAGFMAAAAQAGLSPDDVFRHLTDSACLK